MKIQPALGTRHPLMPSLVIKYAMKGYLSPPIVGSLSYGKAANKPASKITGIDPLTNSKEQVLYYQLTHPMDFPHLHSGKVDWETLLTDIQLEHTPDKIGYPSILAGTPAPNTVMEALWQWAALTKDRPLMTRLNQYVDQVIDQSEIEVVNNQTWMPMNLLNVLSSLGNTEFTTKVPPPAEWTWKINQIMSKLNQPQNNTQDRKDHEIAEAMLFTLPESSNSAVWPDSVVAHIIPAHPLTAYKLSHLMLFSHNELAQMSLHKVHPRLRQTLAQINNIYIRRPRQRENTSIAPGILASLAANPTVTDFPVFMDQVKEAIDTLNFTQSLAQSLGENTGDPNRLAPLRQAVIDHGDEAKLYYLKGMSQRIKNKQFDWNRNEMKLVKQAYRNGDTSIQFQAGLILDTYKKAHPGFWKQLYRGLTNAYIRQT